MSSSIAAGIRCGSLPQQLHLVGMIEQADDSVADEAGGRVVAGDDQLEQAGEQFRSVRRSSSSLAVTKTPTRSSWLMVTLVSDEPLE